jgi:hypothetical protein
MSIDPARKFMTTCIISLIISGLIYFLSPNRNVQMATLLVIEGVGGLTIISVIIFIILRVKRKDENY